MADGDRIKIEEINFGSDIPEWATKEIQQKILDALTDSKKTTNKNTKQNEDQKKEAKKLTGLFSVFSKKSEKSDKEQLDVQKRFQKNLADGNKNMTAGIKQAFKRLNEASKKPAEDMAKKTFNTPFRSLNKGLVKGAKMLGVFGLALTAITSTVGFLIGRMKMFSDSFRTVFSMGFRFEQGSMGLARAAVAAEMGIQEYTEILGKYSASVGILGTKAFSDLNLSLRDNLQSVGNLGMAYSELTEFTGSYIEQLKDAGILTNENNEYLEGMAENYLKNITAFTQLANVSRDQIDAVIKSATSIDAFTNRMNTLPATVQRSLLAATQTVAGMFAGLGTEFGDQLATTFTQAYGRGGLFFTEAGRSLLAVNKRLYNSLDGVINNLESMSDQEAAQATADLIDEIANTSDAERERLGIIERSNTEYAAAAGQQIALINKIQQLEEDGRIEIYKDLQRLRQESNVDKMSVAFINFERVIEKFKITFNKFFTALFSNDKLLNSVTSILESFTSKFLDSAEFINNLAEKAGTILQKILLWIGGLFDATKNGASGLFESIMNPLKGILTEGISAGIRRGIAAATPGGYSAEDFQTTDDIVTQLREVSNQMASVKNDPSIAGAQQNNLLSSLEKREKELMVKLTDITGVNFGKLSSNLENRKIILDDGSIVSLAEASSDQLREYVNKEMGKFGYDFNKGAINTPQNENPDKAQDKGMVDPKSLSDTKMRIMKQYLPMTGSSEPGSTAEDQYYSTSLALMQEQLEIARKQLAATEEI